jgi:hypothetical protein
MSGEIEEFDRTSFVRALHSLHTLFGLPVTLSRGMLKPAEIVAMVETGSTATSFYLLGHQGDLQLRHTRTAKPIGTTAPHLLRGVLEQHGRPNGPGQQFSSLLSQSGLLSCRKSFWVLEVPGASQSGTVRLLPQSQAISRSSHLDRMVGVCERLPNTTMRTTPLNLMEIPTDQPGRGDKNEVHTSVWLFNGQGDVISQVPQNRPGLEQVRRHGMRIETIVKRSQKREEGVRFLLRLQRIQRCDGSYVRIVTLNNL